MSRSTENCRTGYESGPKRGLLNADNCARFCLCEAATLDDKEIARQVRGPLVTNMLLL